MDRTKEINLIARDVRSAKIEQLRGVETVVAQVGREKRDDVARLREFVASLPGTAPSV